MYEQAQHMPRKWIHAHAMEEICIRVQIYDGDDDDDEYYMDATA